MPEGILNYKPTTKFDIQMGMKIFIKTPFVVAFEIIQIIYILKDT